MELMAGVGSWIEMLKRDVDLDFLMPIEDVFTITGRGTVATGRIESNKPGDPADIIGKVQKRHSPTVTGIEMLENFDRARQVITLVFFKRY